MSLDLAAIRAAHDRIRAHVTRTPVLTNARLDAACGGSLFFKCDNLQKAGAFKARGAANAVFSLGEAEALRGVATHSSGNHAAALARAAKLRGIPAHIVMPRNAARPKVRMVEAYGGCLTFCEPTQEARERACAAILEATGANLVHPFEDKRVMAGQGTAAVEFLEDVPDLDVMLCPVGGGGLLAGTAVAVRALRPAAQVIGTEPAGADDAARSFHGTTRVPMTDPRTIADGLRTTIGEPNLALARRLVHDIVTVSEAGIIAAMRLLFETLKVVVEPSAAVPYAALMEGRVPAAGRRIGIILSGGNVDLDLPLPWTQASR
jgi:threonine dehydratase